MASNTDAPEEDERIYEEVSLDEMSYEEEEETYYYECPCGDLFEITKVGRGRLVLPTPRICKRACLPAAAGAARGGRNDCAMSQLLPHRTRHPARLCRRRRRDSRDRWC